MRPRQSWMDCWAAVPPRGCQQPVSAAAQEKRHLITAQFLTFAIQVENLKHSPQNFLFIPTNRYLLANTAVSSAQLTTSIQRCCCSVPPTQRANGGINHVILCTQNNNLRENTWKRRCREERRGKDVQLLNPARTSEYLYNLYIIPNFGPKRELLHKNGQGRTLKAPLVPLRCSTYATFVVCCSPAARCEERRNPVNSLLYQVYFYFPNSNIQLRTNKCQTAFCRIYDFSVTYLSKMACCEYLKCYYFQ